MRLLRYLRQLFPDLSERERILLTTLTNGRDRVARRDVIRVGLSGGIFMLTTILIGVLFVNRPIFAPYICVPLPILFLVLPVAVAIFSYMVTANQRDADFLQLLTLTNLTDEERELAFTAANWVHLRVPFGFFVGMLVGTGTGMLIAALLTEAGQALIGGLLVYPVNLVLIVGSALYTYYL
ncbi:MAG: hypothetical protein GYB68_18915, partial [Chloroflexi bacterium]|nr:hypothetical protein [Chloroflexota bacterium]